MIRFMKRSGEHSAVPVELEDYPLSPKLLTLLCQRGLTTRAALDRYLNPSRDDLYDPFLLSDMRAATEVIRDAIAKGEKITVFGDYDVDGVTASAILTAYLKGIGARVDYYIPDRHGEGYGLNREAIERLSTSSKLLITVDCGISCVNEVALARALGMRVIVTDHHTPGPVIPSCEAVINPLLGAYPFRRLCGAGVAFKLVQALGGMEAIEPYWDLAALATIADIVPLVDENRVIVRFGLKDLVRNQRPGLMALIEAAKTSPEKITSSDIAFRIAPRINAGGRLALASRSVELLTTQDEARAKEIASELDAHNERRRDLESEIVREAESMVANEIDFLRDRAIVLCGKGWETGVIGLAAARLVERYHWPCILLSENANGLCTGSARSIPGVNIYEAMATCSDLYERFGGHAQAAGLTIRRGRIQELRDRLNEAIRKQSSPLDFIPTVPYDLEVELKDLNEDFVHDFDRMQPTGHENAQPIFCLKGVRPVDPRGVGKDQSHLRVTLQQNGAACGAIGFRMGEMAEHLPANLEAIVGLSINEWQGARSVQCELKKLQAYQPGKAFIDRCERERDVVDIASLQILRLPEPQDPLEAFETMTLGEVEKGLLPELAEQIQGTLVVVHSLAALGQINIRLAIMHAHVDYALGHPTDPRGFNTVVLAPDWQKMDPRYQRIILADGCLTQGEHAAVLARYGAGKVTLITGIPSKGDALADRLYLSDDALRSVYKLLLKHEKSGASLAMLAEELDMAQGRIYAAVRIFEELGLLRLEEPFRYELCRGSKVSLDSSSLRRTILNLRKEAVHP